MKSLQYYIGLFLILTLISLKQGYGQFNLSVNGGVSIGKAAVFGAEMGYNWQPVHIRAGLKQHASSSINAGTLFETKIGHTFNINDRYYFSGDIGYGYSLKSTDRKGLNEGGLLINPELGYKWEFKEQYMALYLGYTHEIGYHIIAAGIRGYFP